MSDREAAKVLNITRVTAAKWLKQGDMREHCIVLIAYIRPNGVDQLVIGQQLAVRARSQTVMSWLILDVVLARMLMNMLSEVK